MHVARDGKRDGKRQRHDSYDDAGHDVAWDLAAQLLFIGVFDNAEQDWLEFVVLHGFHFVAGCAVAGALAAWAGLWRQKCPAQVAPGGTCAFSVVALRLQGLTMVTL